MKRMRSTSTEEIDSCKKPKPDIVQSQIDITDFFVKELGSLLYVTNKIIGVKTTPTRCIDLLEPHVLNRTINPDRVKELESVLKTVVLSGEFIELSIAIETSSIQSIITDCLSEDHTVVKQTDYKFKILDGQHRWKAIQNIRDLPGMDSLIIHLKIYLASNEKEIVRRIDEINDIRSFSKDEKTQINVTYNFLMAFSALTIGTSGSVIDRVKNCEYIKTDEFRKKHRDVGENQFQELILKLSQAYEEQWNGFVHKLIESNPSHYRRGLVYRVVEKTKLYHLHCLPIDWIKKL
jgi:hypothetical protein